LLQHPSAIESAYANGDVRDIHNFTTAPCRFVRVLSTILLLKKPLTSVEQNRRNRSHTPIVPDKSKTDPAHPGGLPRRPVISRFATGTTTSLPTNFAKRSILLMPLITAGGRNGRDAEAYAVIRLIEVTLVSLEQHPLPFLSAYTACFSPDRHRRR